MTVQELPSYTDLTPRWTEVCPVEHDLGGEVARLPRGERSAGRLEVGRPASGVARNRPPARPDGRRTSRPGAVATARPAVGRQAGPVRTAGHAPVAPGRRVLTSPSRDVRACAVAAPHLGGVVDDVPTWALVACGIVAGVLMLLAVAFLGGPAYT